MSEQSDEELAACVGEAFRELVGEVDHFAGWLAAQGLPASSQVAVLQALQMRVARKLRRTLMTVESAHAFAPTDFLQ